MPRKSKEAEDAAIRKVMKQFNLVPGKNREHLPPVPPSIRKMTLARDGWVCQYCGEKLEPGLEEVDHRLPRAWGGTNDLANLVTSCRYCNRAKSDLLIERLRMTPEGARQAIFGLLRDPENPVFQRHVNALYSKEAIIVRGPEDRVAAAIERLVGVIDIRRRSKQLREGQRKRAEKRVPGML